MAGLLHKLENNEAVLLMYVADELPPEDRAEVDQLLATDASLRAELERIAAAYHSALGALASTDAAHPPASTDDMLARRIVRDLKRHETQLSAWPGIIERARPDRLMPTWSYPLIAAAAALFVYLGLWVFNVVEPQVKMVADPTTATAPADGELADAELDIAGELARSFGLEDADEKEDVIFDLSREPVSDERVAHWML